MQTEVVITESDFIAIARLDDDGAPVHDVVYRVIPDSAATQSEDGAEEAAVSELTEFASA
jgi:hypothetical protein